ncbi:hypothetical protein FPQ18DRAFT_376921 [Pyronema domesticum]|uniref:Uncharacterized protein n=1 Tax=Pyronema omphalodes (strain CBS 100304) TaxID=1076935 RepID=U4KZP6_PYROM|nr:hypothetical protein FPQ18DRAFT_376921 [Pyronema domesticum]CCX07215.1 Protein of unknown function [Pyronema omphalodes CBS 100304]
MGYIPPITRMPLVPKVPALQRRILPSISPGNRFRGVRLRWLIVRLVWWSLWRLLRLLFLGLVPQSQPLPTLLFRTHRGRMVNYASIDAALVKSGGMRRLRTAENLARLVAENAMAKSFTFPAPSSATPTGDTAASGLNSYEDSEEGDEEVNDVDSDSASDSDNDDDKAAGACASK